MYKTVFIDLDDTLWDTRTNGKESMEEIYINYGFGRYFEDFESFYDIYYIHNCILWDNYRKGEISKQELIIDRLQYPLKPHLTLSEEETLSLNEDFLNRTTLKTKLLPHTLEVLDYLKPQYRIYLISNGFEEVQYKKINNSGLASYFDGVILSDAVGVNKPHPAIFNEALKLAGSTPEESIMIGDSWAADIVGAKNAGIDQVWYDLGVESKSEFEPTYHITSLREVKSIL